MGKLLDKNKAELSNAIRGKLTGRPLVKVPMRLYKVWLSYDLGFEDASEKLSNEEKEKKYNERYAALKPWLKANKAVECGNSVARFAYKAKEGLRVDAVLQNEILEVFAKAGITDLRGIRMYVIFASKYRLATEYHEFVFSNFIIGKRHQTSPWDN